MLSNTLKALEDAYSLLNTELFKDELPDACLTIQHAKKKGKYIVLGWFSFGHIWKRNGSDEMFEINITSDCLNKTFIDIIGTLIHEMVHIYCHVNNIEDCKGKKHTELFKEECSKVGLICEKEKSVGWGMTSVSTELMKKIRSFDINEEAFIYSCHEIIEETTPKEKKPKTYYMCPVCNEKIKSKKTDLAIMCVKCSQQFQYIIEEPNS